MSRNLVNQPDRSKPDRLKAALDSNLKRLVGKRVLSPAHATREMDGRLVPFVLATVLDDERRPMPGVPLELRDEEDKVIDSTRTSAAGLGILRFRPRKPRPGRKENEPSRVTVLADGGDVGGTVVLLDGGESPAARKIVIPPNPRFWRLPLVGLEGTVALLIDEAATSVDAATLLDDPGAGTLVQILAPGSYGEVLTGLLDIPIDAVHPLLREVATISPFGEFPSLPTDDATSAVSGVLPLP